MPLVALIGAVQGDAIEPAVNAVLAGAAVGSCWWLVGRLGVERIRDRFWLVVLFGFSTQIPWVTTRGGVWHTGQLIAILLTTWCLIELQGRRRAWLIGLLAGAAFLTRAPLAFALPFYALMCLESGWRPPWRPAVAVVVRPGRRVRARPGRVLLVQRRAVRVAVRVRLRAGPAARLPRSASASIGLFSLAHLPMNLDYFLLHLPRPDPGARRSSSRTASGCPCCVTSPGLLLAFRARSARSADVVAGRGGAGRPRRLAPVLRRRLAAVRLPLFPGFGAVRHRPVRARRRPRRRGRDRWLARCSSSSASWSWPSACTGRITCKASAARVGARYPVAASHFRPGAPTE